MARRKESITLTDPKALRALAHPARQRLINELFGGAVLTATQAAELVDLTPSAVSHHLRELEKWGLATRAEPTRDGRQRPWQGTAKALYLQPTRTPASLGAMQSVVSVQLDTLADHLRDWMSRGEEPWRGAFQGIKTGDLWLTEDEARTLIDTVEGALDHLSRGRTPQRHPKGARRTAFTWSLVPTEPPPEPVSRR